MTTAAIESAASRLLLVVLDASVRALVVAGVAALLLAIVRPRRAAASLTVWTAVLCAAFLVPIGGALLSAMGWTLVMPVAAWAPAPVSLGTLDVVAIADLSALEIPNAAAATSELSWIAIAALGYLAGVSVLLLRASTGWWMARRFARAAWTIADEPARARLAEIAQSRGLRRAPRLLEARDLRVPVTMGTVRPAVVLPPDWRSWDGATLDAVLVHETTHAARRDPLVQQLALLYCALTWCSPLGWWLRRRLADLAEQASDDAALESGADRTAYAEMLVGFFARVASAPQRVAWHVAMARRADAGADRRVDRILNWKGGSPMPRTRSLMVVISLAAAPIVSLAAAVQPGPAPLPPSAPQPSLQTPPPAPVEPAQKPETAQKPEATTRTTSSPGADEISTLVQATTPPPLPPFRRADPTHGNAFGVQLTVAAHEPAVPAAIVGVGARSAETEGAYASVVVRNYTTAPIRSVVIAAVVRPADANEPSRTFASPPLVTWIPDGQTQTLEPRLIDPVTLKELGSRWPQGATAVASVARVEFGDGTVWTPSEPRLPPGAAVLAEPRATGVQQAPGEFGRDAYRRGTPDLVPPRLLTVVHPKYTADGMRAKIQGIVQVEAVVLADGTVGDVRVVRSLDRVFGLDHEALVAARQWRFMPGMRYGEPVPCVVMFQLEFRLH